jgi:hypothetical protein
VPWWKSQTTAVVALVATVVLSMCGSFLTAFLTIGSWVRADIQEVRGDLGQLRGEVQALQTELARLGRDNDERRKQLEYWAAHRFTETCVALKGNYDYNAKLCVLPDGRVMQYEPPYL